MTSLASPHLILRDWRDSDLAPFAALNADPAVMEHFRQPLSREESDAFAGRIQAEMSRQGFGLWAVEIPGVADFIGFVGLSVPEFQAPFTPCVEIGWRLARAHWGRSYAREAAGAVLAHAFEQLPLDEVVSFTVPANLRCRRVMETIGMRRAASDDFQHPAFAEGHRLRRHVLYRLSRTDWMSACTRWRSP